ncbi:MAG: PilZ domain-containing protein [Acidobacteriota bacterium]
MAEALEERRRFPRIPAHCEVVVKALADKLAFPAASTTREVGLGGCSFVSRTPYAQGSRLHLSILPEKTIVEAEGRVAYCRRLPQGSFEVGVAFEAIKPSDQGKLQHLLESSQAGGSSK